MPETLILTGKEIKDLLSMIEVLDAVEDAFKAYGEGKADMPPKSYLRVEKGDFRAMPAHLLGMAGIKWVNVHPENQKLALPTVMGILICSDPETGYPWAVMDATEITAYRTGATAAIASKYLARPDSKVVGVVGAGQNWPKLVARIKRSWMRP